MDISKYIPVGEDNEVEVRLLASGSMLIGSAWLESNTSTEVTIRTTNDTLGANLWVVSDTAITALTPPPPPERSQR